MGQRHQIYLVLPKECNGVTLFKDYNEQETINSNIIPIHHQWLYGQIAIKQLMYFLKYCSKIKEDVLEEGVDNCYHPFVHKHFSNDAKEVFKALYSTNPEGYWHSVIIESYRLVQDPKEGDNNDGITIIDLQDICNPKYCLMYLWDDDERYIQAYKPMSALEYIQVYYPPNEQYYNQTFEDSRRTEEENIDIANTIADLAQVMTTEEVLNLFPTLTK